jgi:hypothetical protein
MKYRRTVVSIIAVYLSSQLGCTSTKRHFAEDWNETEAVGMSYGDARLKLIRQGWRPRVTALEGADGPEREWLTAGSFLALGYIEIELCSGMGLDPCIFNFINDDGQCLRAFTEGGLEARVVSIERFCSPE